MIVCARLQLPLEPRVLGFELLDAWIDEAPSVYTAERPVTAS